MLGRAGRGTVIGNGTALISARGVSASVGSVVPGRHRVQLSDARLGAAAILSKFFDLTHAVIGSPP